MKTPRHGTEAPDPAPCVLRWPVPSLVLRFGLSLAACGGGSSPAPPPPSSLTLKLSLTSKDTVTPVAEHQYTFQLVSMDDGLYEPIAAETVGTGYSASSTAEALERHVNQTDKVNTKNALGKVQSDVASIPHTYQTQFVPIFVNDQVDTTTPLPRLSSRST